MALYQGCQTGGPRRNPVGHALFCALRLSNFIAILGVYLLFRDETQEIRDRFKVKN